MNYQNVSDFFSYYSLPSIVIAVIIAVTCFILDKFVFKKSSHSIKNFLPFLMGIFLYIMYDLIFIGTTPIFSAETLSMGLVCASLSLVFFSIVKRISEHKSLSVLSLSPVALLIESIISTIVKDAFLSETVSDIENLLSSNDEGDDDEKTLKAIAEIIYSKSHESILENECFEIARMVLESVKNLKKDK